GVSWSEARMADLEQRLAADLTAIQTNLETTRASARSEFDRAVARTQTELRAIEEAAGPSAASWDAPFWSRYALPTSLPEAARFGQLTLSSAPPIRTPALLPFPGGNLMVRAAGAAKAQAAALVQGLLLRLITLVPPGKLRLLLIDPVGLGQNVATL